MPSIEKEAAADHEEYTSTVNRWRMQEWRVWRAEVVAAQGRVIAGSWARQRCHEAPGVVGCHDGDRVSVSGGAV